MLILTRRKMEKIVLPDFGVAITVTDIGPGRVRIGIDAPDKIRILREEIMEDSDAAMYVQQKQHFAGSNPS